MKHIRFILFGLAAFALLIVVPVLVMTVDPTGNITKVVLVSAVIIGLAWWTGKCIYE